MPLKVTVVTPVFNGAAHIEATIQSVLVQSYPHIEYIIMDGGSNDGTIAIVQQYARQLKLISEADSGQSDAINKGWHRASGDILAWLCADDLYEPDTVANAIHVLDNTPEAQWVYGTGGSLDAEGRARPYRHAVEPWNYERLLQVHNFVIQPSVFLRREAFQAFGDLRTDLHYAMDYEYWLRIGRTCPGLFTPSIHVQVKRYAAAKTQSGGVRRLQELMTIMHDYAQTELPSGYRHEWATAYLREAWSEFGRGRWNACLVAVHHLGRYPGAVPRGTLKVLLELLPDPVDRQLRRWFIRT